MRLVPLVALLALSMPAIAQDAPANEAAAQQPAKKEKPVCRRYATTGSIMMGKKVCHTNDEWKKIDGASNANALRDRQNTPSNGPGGR